MAIIVNQVKQTTALDVIHGALRLLKVLSPDTQLTDMEAVDALSTLNNMLDGWSNESMMLTSIVEESFALTPSQASYSIGLGGNFNTERPLQIEMAVVSVGDIDYPVASLAYDDWVAIGAKGLSGMPCYIYLDNTYPLGNIRLHPVPSLASSLKLYSRKPFAKFSGMTNAISLPPGYERAMRYCLAIEIAPEYQATAGADILMLALSAKAGIKRTNKRPLTFQCDPALLGGGSYNIYRGQ